MATYRSNKIKREDPRIWKAPVFPGKNVLASKSDKQPDTVSVKCPYGNGLISTIARAYSEHAKLVLRPDDIFHSILISFGTYVTSKPEEMRKYLVNHDGEMDITIKCDGEFNPNIEALAHPINSAFKKTMKHATAIAKWSKPKFSTTTEFDKLLSRIELMGAVKRFFGYKFEYQCGLSEVQLLGTVADWKKLLKKVKFIKSIDDEMMQKWAINLQTILRQFIAVYKGVWEENFWQSVCKEERYGSGGQSRVTGWMLHFAPFDSKGEYMTEGDQYDILGKCELPIQIDNNGDKFAITINAGSIGIGVRNNAYVPINGMYVMKS